MRIKIVSCAIFVFALSVETLLGGVEPLKIYLDSAKGGGNYTQQKWDFGTTTNSFDYTDTLSALRYAPYSGTYSYSTPYFQVPLADLGSINLDSVESITLNFYLKSHKSGVEIRHYSSASGSGDSGQRLSGNELILTTASDDGFVVDAWNSIDIMEYIVADFEKSFDFSAFSLTYGAATDDFSSFSFWGPAAVGIDGNGDSLKPYVQVALIPEASTYAVLFGVATLLFVVFRRKK